MARKSRPRQELWIDGYNVIHKLRLGEGRSLEERRAELAARVSALGVTAWIVFDSQEPGERAPTARPFPRVRVQFARGGHSADEVLIARMRATSDASKHTIVSDDQEIVRTARAQGFEVLAVAAFGAKLKPVPDPGASSDRPLRPDEVRDWMEWFGLPPSGTEDDPLPRGRSPEP